LNEVNKIELSICISTRNRGPFIGATLESIIRQANEQVEIVVLDGASSDNTEEVVRSYQELFVRLRYFQQQANGGVDQGYAEAVSLAQGEYCWLFSDDDVLMDGAISSVLAAIAQKYGLIIANAEVRNPDLSQVLEQKRLPLNEDRIYKSSEGGRLLADVANYLTFIGCVIIRRALWDSRDKIKYVGSCFVHVGVLFQSTLLEDTLVVAKPLIVIRYGNASWLERYFEIWMFKWPDLIWSFADYPDWAKLQVCPREPWRRAKTLLLHRAKGTYTKKAYIDWLKPRLGSYRARSIARAIAHLPGRIVNFLAYVYYSVFYRRTDRLLVLMDLKNSPYFGRFAGRRAHVKATRSVSG
jgi:abequosyltransferase